MLAFMHVQEACESAVTTAAPAEAIQQRGLPLPLTATLRAEASH